MASGGTDSQCALDLVGLSLTEKRMRILGALLRTPSDPEGYRDFKDIHQLLVETEESRDVPRNTVYEILSALERKQFVRVDRLRHRHRYLADTETISTAMSRLLSENIEHRINHVSRVISPEENELRDLMEDSSLGERAAASLCGKQFRSEPKLATELEQIESLVRTDVLSKCRKGDIIRLFFHPLEGRMLDDGSAIAIGKFLSNGCDVRMMLHSDTYTEADITGRLKHASEEAARSELRLIVRLRTRGTKIYESIACGSRGILLVISGDPLIVTYVPRSVNESLVDHAIETFDKEFSESKLILDTLGQESG